jgi:hypothetical protein
MDLGAIGFFLCPVMLFAPAAAGIAATNSDTYG